jgi:hypothetical protein
MYTTETVSLEVGSLQAGVDWITVTASEDDQRKALFTRFQVARERQQATVGQIIKPFKWRGYCGLSMSGLRWGTRLDSDILIASGPLANTYWKLFARSATNITRLDLAVTCEVNPPLPKLHETYYNNLGYEGSNWAKWDNNRKKGKTLYVGSRISDQIGRIYDKGREADLTPVSGSIWRYEIEYHREYAQQAINRLLVETCPRLGPGKLITSTVYKWFDYRNIPPIFSLRNTSPPIEVHCHARDEDTERSLTWLRVQVSPTVRRLIGARRTDVLDALGLAECDPSYYGPSI